MTLWNVERNIAFSYVSNVVEFDGSGSRGLKLLHKFMEIIKKEIWKILININYLLYRLMQYSLHLII